MMSTLKRIWMNIRRLSGDDAYERYLLQYAEHATEHGHDEPPLSKQAFFKEWQDGQWKGIKRCC